MEAPIRGEDEDDIHKILSKITDKFNTAYKQHSYSKNAVLRAAQKIRTDYSASFYSKYGTDLIVALGIVLLYIFASLYFYLLNKVPVILADWDEDKCNPFYMQFMNVILPDKNKTRLEQSQDTFNACVKNALLKDNTTPPPVYYTLDTLTKSYDEQMAAIAAVNGEFDMMRDDVGEIATSIYDRIGGVASSQERQLIATKDGLNRLNSGIIGASYSQKYIPYDIL